MRIGCLVFEVPQLLGQTIDVLITWPLEQTTVGLARHQPLLGLPAIYKMLVVEDRPAWSFIDHPALLQNCPHWCFEGLP